MTDRRELQVLLACCEAAQYAKVPWWQIARVAERAGSAVLLVEGPWDPADRWEDEAATAIARYVTPESIDRWGQALDQWTTSDPSHQFVTVLDEDFPVSLRLVFNPPPFVTVRGHLVPEDARGVAVVGTRDPTTEGVRRAFQLGRDLASDGITVYSGLARGIDTAAHKGALEAGGRTVAVLGHGLLHKIYPPENADLASVIAERGALVSQFRPDAHPTRHTFGMRNVVTSGLSQGTVVVEAGGTSGARMQARFAAEQGKRVWLLSSLVAAYPSWTEEFLRKYADHTRVVGTVEEVVQELRDERSLRAQAAGSLPPVPRVEADRRPPAGPLQLSMRSG